MFKLRFYKLTGPNKGNTDHEETYSNINDMLAGYYEAVKDIPKFQALEPTMWIYQDDINGYNRLFWGDEYNGITVNEIYQNIVNAYEAPEKHEKTIAAIVDRYGGYREHEILSNPHTFEYGGTWNNEHKIIDVLERDAGPGGYRGGFSFDLVTKTVCG